MKKAYVQPDFERTFRLNISLDELERLFKTFRYSAYQLELRRDVYGDLLFNLKGFAGTVFEIQGVAQSLEDELVEVRYNKRYEVLEMRPIDRTVTILVFFLLAAGLSLLSYIFFHLNISSIAGLFTMLTCLSWPALLYVIDLMQRNPYERDHRKAIMGLSKLEEDMIKTLVDENPEEILAAIFVDEARKLKGQNHES